MKTDAQLIKEARTNADAFAELYERYVRSVHAWFRTRVEPASAMDLTAETFAQAAGGLRRFRDESDGSAGPWLFGIAKNLHRRFLERRRVETVGRRESPCRGRGHLYRRRADARRDRGAHDSGRNRAAGSPEGCGDCSSGRRDASRLRGRALQGTPLRGRAGALGLRRRGARVNAHARSPKHGHAGHALAGRPTMRYLMSVLTGESITLSFSSCRLSEPMCPKSRRPSPSSTGISETWIWSSKPALISC